jgi:hypothetical protein
MPFKPLTLAVTAASQRELFQVPLAARQQAFLSPAQPAAMSPLADVVPAYPPAAVWGEPAYVLEDAEAAEAESSWLGWGALAAAAVAGAAIGQAGTKKPTRATPTDELVAGLVEHELRAASVAEKKASTQTLAMLTVSAEEKFDGVAYAKALPGVIEPTGFFDPMGFCSADDITEGKIKFYREVELKHGRVGMLAALGFLVGENFHPLFGGDIDVPAYLAFQQTPLQTFWPAVVLAIAIPEIFSVFSFKTPALFAQKGADAGMPWEIRPGFESGDLGFDPLGLKPTDPEELKEMKTKELQNGRLGMIAAAGMIAQELASNQKIFTLSVGGKEVVYGDAKTSRRELMTRVAAAAPLLVAALPALADEFGNQDGKRYDQGGASGGAGFSLVTSSGAPGLAGRSGGKIPTIRAAGTWKDPAHPGCTRKIQLSGNTAFISGADEDGKPWKVKGQIQGNSIFVDFTPKGGPSGVEAKFVIGKGLVFPDGNVWSKA